MKPHLSQEQFARCFLGTAASVERRHLLDCGECRQELESFATSVASLRSAIRGRVDSHDGAHDGAHTATQPVFSPGFDRMPQARWALASVAILLIGMLPLLTTLPARNVHPAPVATSPEALMNAINVHLSRTVPSPMEPMMSLVPGDKVLIVIGGIQ
jgi:predicted anti-sigma-YlaC factor YlaD